MGVAGTNLQLNAKGYQSHQYEYAEKMFLKKSISK